MASSQKLGNYPSFLIIASLSTALFIAGFCGWLTLSSRSLIKNMKQNVEIQAYLDKELDEVKIDSIKTIIAQKPYIVKKNPDFEYNFVSRDQAAERFKKDTKEDYTSILGDNPFRDAISIKINDKYFEEAKLKEIEADLESIDGVFDADFARNFIETINANISKIYFVLITFVFLMLLGILFLVNNTIRLALFSQRFIIRSMQLVGATDSFIRKPFLLKGILQGGIAGAIAMLVLLMIQQLAIQQIDGFSLIQNSTEFVILAIIIILIGCFMGFASTYLALNRYLKLDLDELF
jgi:cell division transport system permease protein